jgi:alkylhydroperoxidase family enzyme
VVALGSRELVDAVLQDPKTAPIDARLRATLLFLEKLTLTPLELGAGDAAALRKAGVSKAAARDAIHVATLFNIIDRLADAFGFQVNDARGLRWVPRILLKAGYGAGSIPG